MITLLWANIRHKKGSFVSIILLTLIVAMSVTTILSIQESVREGVENAHEMADTPDLWVQYYACKLTDQTIDTVRNDKGVGRVKVTDMLYASKSSMNDEENANANSVMLMKTPENARLLKEDISGIKGDAPALKKGEIYVPQGLLTNLHGKVGQKITMETLAGEYTFTVKGIVMDPMVGASVIGWKRFYISDEDYAEMEPAIAAKETEEEHGIGKALDIYKAEDCKLTDAKFCRQLNIDTGVLVMGMSSLTKDMAVHYTILFPQIISSILMVFVLLLLGIVLIVMVHSISVEIESNYITFGILKAQGFGTGKLRVLFLLQYLLAEAAGSVVGILLSIPLIRITVNIFAPITAVSAIPSVPVAIILLILLSLFVLSVVSIRIVTVRLDKISPVRAIAGAKQEIYFDSRLNAPISKRLLSASLALRQFTSAKRRYAGMFLIVAILVFFMMTISVLSNMINSKSAVESMGGIVSEVDVEPQKQVTDEEFAEIEAEIERYTKIEKCYYYTADYFFFDGEEIMCQAYKDPAVMPFLKGRAPVYDNEIAVSPILLDEFGLAIGDEVTVGYEDTKATYLISGTLQLMNDAGRCFIISYDGAEKLGYQGWLWGCYSLENEENAEKIADALNDKFDDSIEASASDRFLDETYQIAINVMQLIIYVFSIIFSLVVVQMVCSKAFIGERRDIGIYKALGFTSVKLRLQFAVRFFIVAVFGALAGSIFSYLFSGKMLGVLLRGVGITSFVTKFGVLTILAPVVSICISFFVFAFLASGRIKRVEIRELVTE